MKKSLLIITALSGIALVLPALAQFGNQPPRSSAGMQQRQSSSSSYRRMPSGLPRTGEGGMAQ